MDPSLMNRLIDANNLLATAMTELAADPNLASNLHWRDNLEQSAYGITSLLATIDLIPDPEED